MTNGELELLCQERKSAVSLREDADKEVKKLTTQIGEEMSERGVERVELEGFVPKIINQTRHLIDKMKLLELGVPMATIEAATTESVHTFVRVDERREPKKKTKVA